MAVDDYTRRVLDQRLEDVLGLEAATALMEHLPPTGWADVATKRDLDALASLTKHDLAEHAAVMKHDLAEHAAVTRHELAATQHQLDVLSVNLDAMGDRLRAEFHAGATAQTRTLMFGFFAANATVLAMAAAIARLF